MLTLLTAAALQTCVIAYADDRPSTLEIRAHELAHANGWTHPEQKWILPPKGYVAIKPPAKFVRVPTSCRLEEMPLPTPVVQELCKAMTGRRSYGCMWQED